MIAPAATIVQIRGKYIKIRCPYCDGFHEHEKGAVPITPGAVFHRAPGCGLTRTGAERLTGYTITIPAN
ncbi:hypothetical protein [Pseudarthrobacter oxydans]|uniref:hypothetical protein n=1 Tax=Pseudarthrobacter oxydans TaxID=1671 RepID=UPI00344D9A1B